MLQRAEVGNVDVQLHVENAGQPFWLIVTKGREIVSRIFDSHAEAQGAFEHVAFRFACENLKSIIGDEGRFIRLLEGLNRAQRDADFVALVKAHDEAALEPVLLRLLEQSEAAAR